MSDPKNRSKTRSLIKVEPLFENAIDVGDYITKKFDYEIKSDLYNHNDECLIYDLIREIAYDKDSKIQRPMIVLSPDISISSATISGNAERHLTRTGVIHDIRGTRVDGIEFSTELRVLYISSKLGLNTNTYDGIQDYQKSIVSNAMGLTEESFTHHNVTLKPKNVIYVGIRDDLIEQSEQDVLDSLTDRPTIFTLEDVRSKGIERVMKYVQNCFKNQKVHVVLDLSAVSVEIAPSVFRFRAESKTNRDHNQEEELSETLEEFNHEFRGLGRSDIMEIMKSVVLFKDEKRLEGFDLIGYNFSIEEHRADAHPSNMVTSKLMIDILKCVSDFTEHTINIFDENSKFLIWKKVPTPQTTDDMLDDLIGWYILRNVDLRTRNELISHFEKAKLEAEQGSSASGDANENEDDDIATRLKQLEYPIERFEFPDDDGDMLDVLISVTSPAEQNLKSHYFAQSYTDRCLMPGQKMDMTFELLATPSAIKTLNEEETKLKADQGDGSEDTSDENDTENRGQIDPQTLEEYNALYAEYQSVLKSTLDGRTDLESEHNESETEFDPKTSNNDSQKKVRFQI